MLASFRSFVTLCIGCFGVSKSGEKGKEKGSPKCKQNIGR
jgi:hypothetical protein